MMEESCIGEDSSRRPAGIVYNSGRMGSAHPARRKKLPAVLATLALAAAVEGALRDSAYASTASVSVSNTSLGVTPQLLGYNMGHYMPNSNTSAWLKYSNANAFRYWAASDDYEPTDDL